MAQKFIIREYGFLGYNDSLPAEFLPKGILADALNVFFRSGEIEKRTGYSLIGNDLGAKACQALKGVEFQNGTKEVIGIFNGTVYKWTGSGNWSAIAGAYTLSTTVYVDIVVANNNVYFFDGTNTVPKYDGASMTTVGTIPLGKYARWFHNQLHVAGISGTLNTLQSSVIGDPETFAGGTSSSLGINPNDGDFITALNVLKDELIIFKRNAVWALAGFDATTLTLAKVNERLTGIGCMSHRGVVNTGNDLLYPSFLGNTPVIRSLTRVREGYVMDAGVISDDINGTMDGLNKAKLTECAGVYDGQYAWFSFANGASTTNNLVLTLDTNTLNNKNKGWSRHTGINASAFETFSVSSTVEMYFGESSADSKAYVLDSSTDDNGTAITFSIKTRRYGGEELSIKKKYKWLYVISKEVGDYDVTVNYSLDGFTFGLLDTINLSGTGSEFDDIVLDRSRLGETDTNTARLTIPKSRDRFIQFQFTDTSATSSVTIRAWDLYFYKKSPTEPL